MEKTYLVILWTLVATDLLLTVTGIYSPNSDGCVNGKGVNCQTKGCSRGYTDPPECKTRCTRDRFGLGCSFKCHCPVDDTCDPVNGQCSSQQCSHGYSSAGCQIQLPIFSIAPNVSVLTKNSVKVMWRPWKLHVDYGQGPIGRYVLQVKNELSDFTDYSTFLVRTKPEPVLYTTIVSELETSLKYKFRVAVSRADSGKMSIAYPGPVSEEITLCSEPFEPVSNLAPNEIAQAPGFIKILLTWEEPPFDTSGCMNIEFYKVTLRCKSLCTVQTKIIYMPTITALFVDIPNNDVKYVTIVPVNDADLAGPIASVTIRASATSLSNMQYKQPSLLYCSTSENSMQLKWSDVGASRYEVVVQIEKSYYNHKLAGYIEQNMTIEGTYVMLKDLHHATLYSMHVRPIPGTSVYVQKRWTNPLCPTTPLNPLILHVTDQTALVYIQKLILTTGPLTKYEIVMELLSDATKESSNVDYHDLFYHLKSYTDSIGAKMPFYLAAVLRSDTLWKGFNFSIGDNKVYNGYHNVPLRPNRRYVLWIGISSCLDYINKKVYVNIQSEGNDGSTFKTTALNSSGFKKRTNFRYIVVTIVIIIGSILCCVILVSLMTGKSGSIFSSDSDKVKYFLELFKTGTVKWMNWMNCMKTQGERIEDIVEISSSSGSSGSGSGSSIEYENSSIEMYVHEFIQKYSKLKDLPSIKKEYKSIKQRGYSGNSKIALNRRNIHLNRSKYVVPYDSNRVTLLTKATDEQFYINATLLKSKNQTTYIVTQMPFPETLGQFWQMVNSYKACRIVMLFNPDKESNDKIIPNYWPNEGSKERFEELSVKLLKESKYAYYTERTFELKIEDNKKGRLVKHYQYLEWGADKDIPGIKGGIIAFLDFVNRCQMNVISSDDSCIVHCETGCGPCGTYLAIEILLQIAKKYDCINIKNCVYRLTRERKGLINTLLQYRYIYLAMYFALLYKDTVVTAKSLSRYVTNTKFVSHRKSFIQKEYETLLELINQQWIGTSCLKIVHEDSQAPNGVTIHSYREENFYLALNYPSKKKWEDVWDIVKKNNCSCMVQLLDPKADIFVFNSQDQEYCYGDWVIRQLFRHEHGNMIREKKLSLVQPSTKEYSEICLYRIDWPKDASTPDISAMLQLCNLVARSTRINSGRVAIMNDRNISKNGLFTISAVLLDKLETEGELSILHLAHHLKAQLPEAISSVEEYHFCYCLAKEYFQQNEKRGVKHSKESATQIKSTEDPATDRNPSTLKFTTPQGEPLHLQITRPSLPENEGFGKTYFKSNIKPDSVTGSVIEETEELEAIEPPQYDADRLSPVDYTQHYDPIASGTQHYDPIASGSVPINQISCEMKTWQDHLEETGDSNGNSQITIQLQQVQYSEDEDEPKC